MKDNFKKYRRSFVDSLGIPYDYESLMHYDDKAFSKNPKLGLQTIITKDKKVCYYDSYSSSFSFCFPIS